MHKLMRIIVFFDLPVKTKQQRRTATQFRNFLLKDGYFMIQYSVYARICNGNDNTNMHKNRLKYAVPDNGSIRVLTITEKQFDNMQILLGGISFNEKINDDKNLVLFEYDEKSQDFKYSNEKINKEKKKHRLKQPSLFEF